jgi:hypothetical protein
MQNILILIIFIAAIVYVIHLFRRTFTAKGSECSGCGTGSCSKIDIEKIEKEMQVK